MSNGQQHMHMRKRLYKYAEPFPHPRPFKRYLDYGMYVVGLIAPVALIPQAIQIYRTHSVAGLSLLTWGLLTAVNVMWAVYGLVHREKAIFLSNFLVACMNAMVSVGIILFR